ncbi:hypothetical protein A6V36_18145 [Paraburkholderia ginsengiterrae]|uniref:2Fe-2S ferredoxin n=1 Tax=Paraburkholderia ginsengiterrae TaxID=1462993 RepID=A0A1A9MYT8_9BURK|nr:NAD(P)H dependent flavin oxidoreductase family protein [Paraburkholderia ginsengiterrae]OAJ52049.1 hypothetical protein A6V37_10325 [Paraburkholderia ginsengiterrae]OAJ63411.1 hypothetical protein A6V36_18145 [Paraburkholderia ginsengiterrae]
MTASVCTFHPHGTAFSCEGQSTILDAALAAGVSVPFSCRRGACGSCVAEVLSGAHERVAPPALDEFEPGPNRLLMCKTRALGQLTLEVPNWVPTPAPTRRTVRVVVVEPLSPDVWRLVVAPLPGESFETRAGQHLQFLLEGGEHRSFSVANLRNTHEPLELHIRRVPGGIFSDVLLRQLAAGDSMTVDGPFGLPPAPSREHVRRLVLLATGTGYAGVRPVLLEALHSEQYDSIALYWGGRHTDDHYAADELNSLAESHPRFRWTAVVPRKTKAYAGRDSALQHHVQDYALADGGNWQTTRVHACGNTGMVSDARAALTAAGLPSEQWHADAFVPSGKNVPDSRAWERVGPRFRREGILAARERSIDAVYDIAAQLRPGMTMAEATELADRRLRELGAERNWHPTYIRFGPDTTSLVREPDRARLLCDDDIFFVDIGPVWDGYEGDYADTFVLGEDADRLRCARAVRSIFDETREAWLRGISGEALYTHAEALARTHSCELVREAEGHRISDFPHALYGPHQLAQAGFAPTDGLWVLEIQLRDQTHEIGAFFEDVLLRDDSASSATYRNLQRPDTSPLDS